MTNSFKLSLLTLGMLVVPATSQAMNVTNLPENTQRIVSLINAHSSSDQKERNSPLLDALRKHANYTVLNNRVYLNEDGIREMWQAEASTYDTLTQIAATRMPRPNTSGLLWTTPRQQWQALALAGLTGAWATVCGFALMFNKVI